jgi:hypothetical protein
MPKLPGAAGLSWLQEVILEYLQAQTARTERVGRRYDDQELLARVRSWGVHWYPSRIWEGPTAWTPTERAGFSRALERLEQRGLVERKNRQNPASSRTTYVRLTTRGRSIAKWLRKSSS